MGLGSASCGAFRKGHGVSAVCGSLPTFRKGGGLVDAPGRWVVRGDGQIALLKTLLRRDTEDAGAGIATGAGTASLR